LQPRNPITSDQMESTSFLNTTNSKLFISIHEISTEGIYEKIAAALDSNLGGIKSIECELKWVENWWHYENRIELKPLEHTLDVGHTIQCPHLEGFVHLFFKVELSEGLHLLDDLQSAENELDSRRSSIFIGDLLVPVLANIELVNGEKVTVELLSDDFGIGSPARMANEIIDVINHWINIKPQIAIHLHLSQGLEMGTVEMLNSFHFADESESYMSLFSEFYESTTGKFVSTFEIVDTRDSFILCHSKEESEVYFIIQSPESFLMTHEDIIDQFFQDNDLEYEAMDIIQNHKFELLKGIVIDLQMDMIYIESFEQIELSRYEINSLMTTANKNQQ